MKAWRVAAFPKPAQLINMSSDQLSQGEVLIRCQYSSINYKDALALTSKGKILKNYPLNPGIDAAGVIESDSTGKFKKDQPVLVAGNGLGEERDGGLGEKIRAPSSHIIPLPPNLSAERAMFFGTAGFTAALAIHRMIHNGQTPDQGPILVTGATGGVGSFALCLLKHLGFEAWALTGKKSSLEGYLKSLGAHKVVSLADLNLGERPLEKSLFGGAIDNVGGETLAKILAHVGLWGNVASIGLADKADFQTTVMPFILRGVSLLGASSNNCTQDLRVHLWHQLAGPWNAPQFKNVHREEISLAEALEFAEKMLDRKTFGRIVVKHE